MQISTCRSEQHVIVPRVCHHYTHYNAQGLDGEGGGVVIPHSRSFITRILHPMHNFIKSYFPRAVKSQISHCFWEKSQISRIPSQTMNANMSVKTQNFTIQYQKLVRLVLEISFWQYPIEISVLPVHLVSSGQLLSLNPHLYHPCHS